MRIITIFFEEFEGNRVGNLLEEAIRWNSYTNSMENVLRIGSKKGGC